MRHDGHGLPRQHDGRLRGLADPEVREGVGTRAVSKIDLFLEDLSRRDVL